MSANVPRYKPIIKVARSCFDVAGGVWTVVSMMGRGFWTTSSVGSSSRSVRRAGVRACPLPSRPGVNEVGAAVMQEGVLVWTECEHGRGLGWRNTRGWFEVRCSPDEVGPLGRAHHQVRDDVRPLRYRARLEQVFDIGQEGVAFCASGRGGGQRLEKIGRAQRRLGLSSSSAGRTSPSSGESCAAVVVRASSGASCGLDGLQYVVPFERRHL